MLKNAFAARKCQQNHDSAGKQQLSQELCETPGKKCENMFDAINFNFCFFLLDLIKKKQKNKKKTPTMQHTTLCKFQHYR